MSKEAVTSRGSRPASADTTPAACSMKTAIRPTFLLTCLFILYSSVSLSSCGDDPQSIVAVPPTPTPTVIPEPTLTAVPTPVTTPPPTRPTVAVPSTTTPTATPEPKATVVPTPTHTATPTPTSTPAPTSTPTLSSIVKDVSPGVVQILTPSGTGSGFIIDANGLVVTNAHVVQRFDTVDVRLSGGQTYQGEVLGVDDVTDLALLDLRTSINFEPVDLGDSDTFAVGEDVIAMGFPLGDVLQGSPTTTRGILSAKRVSKSGVNLLQIDAAINPGSSGGPLFDREGRVVGVSTSKLFESGDGRPVEGIGMAVAINEVRDRLDSLSRGGGVSEPSLGKTTTESALAPARSASLVTISAGRGHTCRVKTDGSVECWGWDNHGQSTPPAGSFVSVSAGADHTCAVRTDGSVACWGDDSAGQSTSPAGSFISVSAGWFHSCGVKTDGSLECWGSGYDGKSTLPAGPFISVSARWLHSCGVKTDGSLECWSLSGESTPPDGSFVSVSTGGSHTCGAKIDGSVVCWGGQLQRTVHATDRFIHFCQCGGLTILVD